MMGLGALIKRNTKLYFKDKGMFFLALSYYISTLISTLLICFAALGVCLGYLAYEGWYLTAMDVLYLFLDVCMLVLFGTALSSCVNFFLSTNGQASAAGTIVSAGYGFICGAYMPISQFSEGLQKVISFLPGTYGTSLLRNHALRGVFQEMDNQGYPPEVVEAIKDSVDCNLYFFGDKVELSNMYIIVTVAIAVAIAIYITVNVLTRHKKS